MINNIFFKSPDIVLNKLYSDVQLVKLFPDQKFFADAISLRPPENIVNDYIKQKIKKKFSLSKFIQKNFLFRFENIKYTSEIKVDIFNYIKNLWPSLTRTNKIVYPYDSLLTMPFSYIVPGGRFQELYYWDSYFIIIGLAANNNWDMIRNIINNFAYIIDTFGYILNGNRNYYSSRSNPPFFVLMIDILAMHDGKQVYQYYLPQMKKEYNYWMKGMHELEAGFAVNRLVRMKDGSLLNRYWDDIDRPRTESYLNDIITAKKNKNRLTKEIYRDLRAAASSGWDFSSRWLDNKMELSSIRTTLILPIDLNSLLYYLEYKLEIISTFIGDYKNANLYKIAAQLRKKAINRYFWNENKGYYVDYDWEKNEPRNQLTAATAFPLFNKIAPLNYAHKTIEVIRNKLLKQGGIVTTNNVSGQQWDAPNGWAPLQWIVISGLINYNDQKLAKEIANRFLNNVKKLYNIHNKLFEKYTVENCDLYEVIDGEYKLQDGFGWTNGVVMQLLIMQKYNKIN